MKTVVNSAGPVSGCIKVGLSTFSKCLHLMLTNHLFVILFLSHFVNISIDRNQYGACCFHSSAFAVFFLTQDVEIVRMRYK